MYGSVRETFAQSILPSWRVTVANCRISMVFAWLYNAHLCLLSTALKSFSLNDVLLLHRRLHFSLSESALWIGRKAALLLHKLIKLSILLRQLLLGVYFSLKIIGYPLIWKVTSSNILATYWLPCGLQKCIVAKCKVFESFVLNVDHIELLHFDASCSVVDFVSLENYRVC